MESHKRSIIKTFTWRAIATVVTMCVAWKVTEDAEKAVLLGLLDTFIKLFVYYGHERLWDRISLGRQKPPEYTI